MTEMADGMIKASESISLIREMSQVAGLEEIEREIDQLNKQISNIWAFTAKEQSFSLNPVQRVLIEHCILDDRSVRWVVENIMHGGKNKTNAQYGAMIAKGIRILEFHMKVNGQNVEIDHSNGIRGYRNHKTEIKKALEFYKENITGVAA